MLVAVTGAAALAAISAGSGGAVPVIALAALAFLVTARAIRRSRGIPILTYHSVSASPEWLPWHKDISIRPETLDRQLRLFARMGLTIIDTEALVRAWLTGNPVPDGAVALHFDDGYLDTWVAAAPILRRHGACATVFVSTDFVAPDQPLRPTIDDTETPRWDGYMSWRELRHLERHGPFRVEAHGTDHGRVVTGPGIVNRLNPRNAGILSWIQWAKMPGSKHDWYLRRSWPVPFGSPVHESAPALSAPQWSEAEGCETKAAFALRVRTTLSECRRVFRAQMKRDPVLFCWPQNQTCPQSRLIAQQAGFLATTAGRGRNETGSDPTILARVHIGQDYAGFRCDWIDDLAVRAQIRCFQGYTGWSLVLGGISALRRLTGLGRKTAARLQRSPLIESEKLP